MSTGEILFFDSSISRISSGKLRKIWNSIKEKEAELGHYIWLKYYYELVSCPASFGIELSTYEYYSFYKFEVKREETEKKSTSGSILSTNARKEYKSGRDEGICLSSLGCLRFSKTSKKRVPPARSRWRKGS